MDYALNTQSLKHDRVLVNREQIVMVNKEDTFMIRGKRSRMRTPYPRVGPPVNLEVGELGKLFSTLFTSVLHQLGMHLNNIVTEEEEKKIIRC